MSSLSAIRYQQQFQHSRQFLRPRIGTVANYGTRDPATGLRQIITPDGGTEYTRYLSNSKPDEIVTMPGYNQIGLVGYTSQKPR